MLFQGLERVRGSKTFEHKFVQPLTAFPVPVSGVASAVCGRSSERIEQEAKATISPNTR